MSFNPTQKSQIRYYLGFPDQYRDLYTTLESQLNGALSAESETLVSNLLLSLIAVDASLVSAHSRLKAKKVGSIELNDKELSALRSEGRRFVERLATIFGLYPLRDVFAEGGGSMGGLIPLG